MTPSELQELREQTVTDVETACRALSIGRTLGFQLARERGELCEGVEVIRVGRLLKVPTKPLLSALGYSLEPCECTCRKGGLE
jgi:hypothetical protein